MVVQERQGQRIGGEGGGLVYAGKLPSSHEEELPKGCREKNKKSIHVDSFL